MRARTEELLYLLLWSWDRLQNPTWRNLDDSFEGWVYRKGLRRQLADLERRRFLESHPDLAEPRSPAPVLRLTQAGRLHALGGRDPEAHWRRPWDGCWRLIIYDLPAGEGTKRNRLRNLLRSRGFGWLQKSVWVTPGPLDGGRVLLSEGPVNVQSLVVLEARPIAGQTDAEIVAGAWDFLVINGLYAKHLEVLGRRPDGEVRGELAATALRDWSREERAAWLAAVSADPLLPQELHPTGYLGPKAWQARIAALDQAARQVRSFRG